jgi:hypothetical protein
LTRSVTEGTERFSKRSSAAPFLEIKSRGDNNVSPDELIRLRDRGVTSREQEIKDALARLVERFESLVREAFNNKAAAGDAR